MVGDSIWGEPSETKQDFDSSHDRGSSSVDKLLFSADQDEIYASFYAGGTGAFCTSISSFSLFMLGTATNEPAETKVGTNNYQDLFHPYLVRFGSLS